MHIFTQKDTSVYIQFRLGDDMYYLGECVDLDSIPNPRLGGIDLIQCRTRNGRGFKTLGKKYSPPGSIEVTISELSSDVVSWLEKVQCPFTLYALQRTCGDAGVPSNWKKGAIVYGMEITGDNLNSLSHHLDENENVHEWTLVGEPPRVDVREITAARETTAEAQALNTVTNCGNLFCDDDCGAYTLPCYNLWAGADAAAGTANVQHSHDNGTTWAAAAADPFAATRNVASVVCFEIAAGVNRILAAPGTLAATNLGVAYSDDGGATWTTVIVGAIAAEAATGPKSLFALDQYHIWLGSDSGIIYFSDDGGLTWTQQVTTAGAVDVNAIDFADEDVGMAVCDGDVVYTTIDGGLHWTQQTATGGGANLVSCHCFNQNRMLVGTASVAGNSLYITYDGGTTWAARTFTGHALEAVTDMDFWNDGVGYIITNTVAPAGSLHQTIDGGATWKEIAIPANSGLNAVDLCGLNEGFVVGEVNAATAFIAHFG